MRAVLLFLLLSWQDRKSQIAVDTFSNPRFCLMLRSANSRTKGCFCFFFYFFDFTLVAGNRHFIWRHLVMLPSIPFLKKSFNDIFTEPDGKTFCPIRIVGLLGTLQGLGMNAYDVFIQHAHFDLQAFGLGLAATLTALGAALGFKKDSQP